jgi:hypothetical protein
LVARELLRGDGTKKDLWCLQVADRWGRILFTVPFSVVDPNLDHLQQETRELVAQTRDARRRLVEQMFWSHQLMAHAHARRRPAKPYLIAESGHHVA